MYRFVSASLFSLASRAIPALEMRGQPVKFDLERSYIRLDPHLVGTTSFITLQVAWPRASLCGAGQSNYQGLLIIGNICGVSPLSSLDDILE